MTARRNSLSPGWIILLICLPIFLGALDLTVVSAVLPHVVYDLEVPLQSGLDSAAWVVSGYLLAYSVPMTFMGALSDRLGRRRVYLALAIFALGSYLVAAADGWPTRLALQLAYRLGDARPDPAFTALWVLVGALSIEVLYVVGFYVGVQNVVGGAAHQVLLAQMAGRKRLVEANAKISLGETSAALVGPGLAGVPIQAVTAPFAILLDALAFLGAALLMRRVRVRSDVPHPGPRASVNSEIVEGLKLVWHNCTLFALAWVAGLWQLLHHMQMAVLVLFATRELGLSAGAIGFAYMFGGVGRVLAAASAERLPTGLRSL